MQNDFDLFDTYSRAASVDKYKSPLLSNKTFENLGLREELVRGAYAMKFSVPSKIQGETLPYLISDPPKNLIAQAKNGTGKSVAYILAMLHRTIEHEAYPQGICVLPTRELARQVYEVAKEISKFTRIRSALLLRDTENRRQNLNSHIIIGTAGSLRSSLYKKLIDTSHLKTLVLDEADLMLEVEGFRDDAIRIKKSITSRQCQIILFSATFPHRVKEFASTFAHDSNCILINEEELSLENVTQFYLDCDNAEQRYDAVCNIYNFLTVSQSIIFCRTRISADELASRMVNEGHNVRCLHGGMTSEERDKMINDFRSGEFKVLIATNLMARGIDISQVSLVINYDLPTDKDGNIDVEAYLHRVGRTGRFGRKGVSIVLIYNHITWKEMTCIEEHFKISMHKIPTNNWEEAEAIIKELLH